MLIFSWIYGLLTVCFHRCPMDFRLNQTTAELDLIWLVHNHLSTLKCLYETRFVSCFCVLGYFFRGGGFSIRQSIYTQQGNMLVDRCTGGYLVRFIHFNTLIAQQWWRFFLTNGLRHIVGVFFRPWALPGECDGGSSNQIQALFNSQKFHVLMFWYYMF